MAKRHIRLRCVREKSPSSRCSLPKSPRFVCFPYFLHFSPISASSPVPSSPTSAHSLSHLLQSHAQAYTERVNEAYASNPSYQYLQINLQENVLKSLLVNLFLSSLRSTIPTALHPTYLVSRQNMVRSSFSTHSTSSSTHSRSVADGRGANVFCLCVF